VRTTLYILPELLGVRGMTYLIYVLHVGMAGEQQSLVIITI
jgi:hypothetical protein